MGGLGCQRAPNPPEFAQPHLRRVKWHGSNTPKFVASHLGNTSRTGTNTPKFVPLAGDDRRLTYSNGAVQIRVGLELAEVGGTLDRSVLLKVEGETIEHAKYEIRTPAITRRRSSQGGQGDQVDER